MQSNELQLLVVSTSSIEEDPSHPVEEVNPPPSSTQHSSSSVTSRCSVTSIDGYSYSFSESNNGSHEECNLSEYEKLRARNIERNNKRMVELGLMSEIEAKVANRKAWKKSNDISSEKHNSDKSSSTCRRQSAQNKRGGEGSILKERTSKEESNNDKFNKSVSSNRTSGRKRKLQSQHQNGENVQLRKLRKRKEKTFPSDAAPAGAAATRKSLSKRRKKNPLEAEGIWV